MVRIFLFLLVISPLLTVQFSSVVIPDEEFLKELEVEKSTYRANTVSYGEILVGFTLFTLVMVIGYYKRIADNDREFSIKFDLFLSRPQGIRRIEELHI